MCSHCRCTLSPCHVGQHTILGEGTLAATMSVKRPAITMLMLDDDADTASTCSVLPAAAGGRICIYGGEKSSDLDPITATAFVSDRPSIASQVACVLELCGWHFGTQRNTQGGEYSWNVRDPETREAVANACMHCTLVLRRLHRAARY